MIKNIFWHTPPTFVSAANKFVICFYCRDTYNTIALVTSPFYNLKDWMSLMRKRKKNNKHTLTLCAISQEDISQVAVIVYQSLKAAEWENICVGTSFQGLLVHLQLTQWLSSSAVLLSCFTLAPQLQPGQVHGCYLNDVLILVKQFCVWLNRGSVSQESQY